MLTRGMRWDTSGNPPNGASMRERLANALCPCARANPRYPAGRAEPGWSRPLQVTSLRAPNVGADPLDGVSHHFFAGHGPPRPHPALASDRPGFTPNYR